MIVEVGNVSARVTSATAEERVWLHDYLTFPNDKARFIPGAKPNYSLFNSYRGSFPTGLVPAVKRVASEEAGFQVQLLDRRKRPCDPAPENVDLSWLRPYQREAVEAVYKQTRGILHIATGGGKGSIIVALAESIPCRWGFMVHRATLIQQQARRYESITKKKAGIVAEGIWDVPDDCEFVCVSFQTAYAHLKNPEKAAKMQALLDSFDACGYDECHVAPADSFSMCIDAMPNCYWRVGMSGTPLDRGDRRSVKAIGSIGNVIYKKSAAELADEGYLTKPTIKLLKVRAKPSKAISWPGVYTDVVVKASHRMGAIAEEAVDIEKPAMVFVTQIAHGKAVTKALERKGLKARFVWGSSATVQRETAIRDLEAGRLDILVSSTVLVEGADIPSLRGAIIAGGGKSVIQTLQRIGRGMRIEKGKESFQVVDIFDDGCTAQGCSHYACKKAREHSLDREKAYLKEKHDVTTKEFIG